MTKYFYKHTLIGIKITGFPQGSVPQTDPKEAVGVLTFKHPRGAYFKAHVHRPKKRVTNQRQECFIVRKGRIKMNLYGPDKKKFRSITLKAGELFVAMRGGHDISVLEDCELFEVKNGPFQEDKIFI